MFRGLRPRTMADRITWRCRQALGAWRTVACALALLSAAPAVGSAQGGTSDAPVRQIPFDNRAVVHFTMSNGIADSALAAATVTVSRQAGVSITGPFAAPGQPGARVVFTHVVHNRGTDADSIDLAATAPAGWTATWYLDANNDGTLDAGDPLVSGPLLLAVGASANVLMAIDVPASAVSGTSGTVALGATSRNDSRAAATTSDVVNVVFVAPPMPALTLTKSADRTSATIGDTVRYTLAFANGGTGDAAGVQLTDTIPAALLYVPASMRLRGAAVSDANDADAGWAELLPDGRTVVHLTAGSVPAGSSGSALFTTVVAPTAAAGNVLNVATASYADTAGTFSTITTGSMTVRVGTASLALTKQIVGATRVVVGTTVPYRLAWTNGATVAANNAVLVDTVPAELVVVSAPGATITGQVVTWTLGSVGAGASGTVDLTTRVVSLPASGDSVINVATLAADNAVPSTARAKLVVAQFGGSDLQIAKTAAALEASIGDIIPYAVTLTNTGPAPLTGVVVHDRLPDGLRLAGSGLVGADSVTTNGRDLAFWIAGPIAPGASWVLRYAAVVASPKAGARLVNVASATAEGGLVRSDTARASVALRRQFAMRDRAMIGKVWLDRNDDGIQEAGEEGVPGVQVWDANGEIVTTDKEGRFSFRDVATGAHALRLDPLGIPKGFVLPDVRDEVVVVQADGWTMPRVSIRLVPRLDLPDFDCACAAVADSIAGVSAASLTGGVPVAPRPSAAPATPLPPTIAPLLSAEQRQQVARQDLITGTTAQIIAPADGSVLTSGRIFIGVRGAADAPMRLYDGDKLIRTGTVRGDGLAEFVAVEMKPGPHRLRAVVGEGDGERWDSVAVHGSGEPARFELPKDAVQLRGDAAAAVPVRVRVLDKWGVPVAKGPMITVAVRGGRVEGVDADPSSVGLQLRTDAAGWLTLPLRAGHDVGTGELSLVADSAHAELPLQIMASVRPLLATGVGQIGVGAAPSSFGAVTLQGAVAANTSVSVSYDSRRNDRENQFFQRGYDPLDENRYPTFGDASERRIVAPSTKALSARVDHGMDWLAAGDVQTQGFGRDGELGAYRRSLTGVSGRVGTGALTWHGFGSMTRQMQERQQLRGDGSTGPYLVGGGIRPGTELVSIEVRARENAARIVARQQLARTADYQIDYETGAILLRLPIPAADPYGNPVFLVATVERTGGGTAHFVGGARVDLDASRWLPAVVPGLDSLTFGVSGVHDAGAAAATTGLSAPTNLMNADVRARTGALSLGAGILRSKSTDSTGTAASADAKLSLADNRFAVDGKWLTVGRGLGPTVDPRLASAVDELSLGVTARFTTDDELRLHHDREHFGQFGVDRQTTGLSGKQLWGKRQVTQELNLVSDAIGGTTPTAARSISGRVSTGITSWMETWVDASHSFSDDPAAAVVARPNQIGAGATFRLMDKLKLEASHRMMRSVGDSVTYGVSSARLRAEGVLGGAMWTGFEESRSGLADEVRASHSVLFGWNQRLPLGGGWQATSMLERRIGLSRASLADPVRALPFAQAETDRTSLAAGLAWLPGGDRARLNLAGETHNGQGMRGSRLQLTADAALNAGTALLTLHDWSVRRQPGIGGISTFGRDDRSLVALALRPVTTDVFNALAKLEWRRTLNPIGGAVLASNGMDTRLIGATDAIWSPDPAMEVSARYAIRFSESGVAGDSVQRVKLAEHFGGARIERRLVRALSVRGDARALLEAGSHTAVWSAAPSLLYDFDGHIVLEAGYRFGPLRDPDFAATGGAGAFATVGVRFTEHSLVSPAAFWRERLGEDR